MKRRRRVVRFGLRGALAALTLLCAACAWFANAFHRYRGQEGAVSRIHVAGGAVSYDGSFGGRIGYVFPRVNYVEFSGSFGPREVNILRRLRRVVTLNLREVAAKPGAVESIPDVCPQLEELYMSRTSTGDQQLEALSQCKELRYLDVSHTKVTDEGLRYFSRHQRLEGLVLSSTKVTDAGMKHIAVIPNLHGVELSGTSVSDEGLGVLSSSRTLKIVYVSGTEVTEQGVADFDDKNKSCLVVYDREPP